MSELETYGMLFYGFSKDCAVTVHSVISDALSKEIDLISASSCEGEKLEDIIVRNGSGSFDEKDEAFLMLLGFDDDMLRNALESYPKNLRRPIFCTLTKNNLLWTPEFLLEHLIEERENFDRE